MPFIQVLVSGILVGGLYIAISSGLTYAVGVSGIVNFAHGEFVMLGGYLTYFLWVTFHLSPLLTFPVAGIGMGLLGAAIYPVIMRKVVREAGEREHDQLIVTLGLSIILQNIVLVFFTADNRQVHDAVIPSLYIGGIFVSGAALAGCLVGLALGIALFVFSRTSRLGRIMAACRQDPYLASFSGIDVDRINLIAFAISTALAGAAGAFVVSAVYVYPTVGINLLVTAFAIIVIGSLGDIRGAIVVSLLVGVLTSATETYLPQGGTWGYAVPFLLLILILVIRPQGLFKGGAV